MENDPLNKLTINKKTTFDFDIFSREFHQLIRLQYSVKDKTRRAGSGITPLTVLPEQNPSYKCTKVGQHYIHCLEASNGAVQMLSVSVILSLDKT